MKNSKNQTAQTYLTYKQLVNLNSDQQIELLKQEKGIDWNEFPDDRKYGRLIYKIEEEFENEHGKFTRSKFTAHPAKLITREYFNELGIVPNVNDILHDASDDVS